MYVPSADSPRPSSVGSAHSFQSSSSISAGNGGGGRGARGTRDYDICVGEEVRIAIDVALERFRLSEEQKGLKDAFFLDNVLPAIILFIC